MELALDLDHLCPLLRPESKSSVPSVPEDNCNSGLLDVGHLDGGGGWGGCRGEEFFSPGVADI